MDTPKTTTVRAMAFMTAPRYENTFARNHIELALKAAGLPLMVSGGVYYGQCMQSMFEEAIEGGIEYAITVDGDSLFTADHVRRILGIVVGEEHVDAVCAIQARRGDKFPLASVRGKTQITWSGDLLPVSTGHFGLTGIDLRKLADTPKPWFHHKPDPKGGWGDDKIDDDIWFWRQWEEAGNSLYMDAETRIGHLEEMVTVFDDKLQVVHEYPADWRKQNGL